MRISHLEPEKRRVGFTQRWGTEGGEEDAEGESTPATTETAPADAESTPVATETAPADAEATPVETEASVDAEEPKAEVVESAPSEETAEETPVEDVNTNDEEPSENTET